MVIGAKEPLQDWARIDWKAVKKRVKNLRQRIYRATQNGHTHHKIPIKEGGSDKMENLIHLHKVCHQHLHQMSKVQRLQEA